MISGNPYRVLTCNGAMVKFKEKHDGNLELNIFQENNVIGISI